MNLDKPLTSPGSLSLSERDEERRNNLMISKVISTFTFLTFPESFRGEGTQAAADRIPGKERRKILENSRTQKIMGEIYCLHSGRKGRKSKGNHKRTTVIVLFCFSKENKKLRKSKINKLLG